MPDSDSEPKMAPEEGGTKAKEGARNHARLEKRGSGSASPSEKFEEYVLVKLYTDGKDPIHAKNRQMEIERFKTAALPFYVILNAQDEVISTFPGMDTNKQNFIDFLTNASENF